MLTMPVTSPSKWSGRPPVPGRLPGEPRSKEISVRRVDPPPIGSGACPRVHGLRQDEPAEQALAEPVRRVSYPPVAVGPYRHELDRLLDDRLDVELGLGHVREVTPAQSLVTRYTSSCSRARSDTWMPTLSPTLADSTGACSSSIDPTSCVKFECAPATRIVSPTRSSPAVMSTMATSGLPK